MVDIRHKAVTIGSVIGDVPSNRGNNLILGVSRKGLLQTNNIRGVICNVIKEIKFP